MTSTDYVALRCMDCGYDTTDEWYTVKDEVWLQACGYIEGKLPGEGLGKQFLCIGCLERRIGRTLMCYDFTDAPVNNPFGDKFRSDRLFNRLIAKAPLLPNDMATLDDYFVFRDIERLPDDERDAAWRSWKSFAGRY